MKSNDNPVTEVVQTESFDLKRPLAILGFAGAGLVGGIAVSHIIDELEMKEIGYVRSKHMPPAVVFLDGKLRHPFRIYADKGGKLCAVVCEIPLHTKGIQDIASSLLDWTKQKGVNELVILEGIAVRGIPKKRITFCVAEPEKLGECEAKGVKRVAAGIIRGIAGSILNECLNRKIIGVALLVPAVAFMADPEGAVAIIETLNHLYGLNISTEKLLSKAEEIKKKLKEIAEQQRKMKTAVDRSGDLEGTYVV